MDRRRLRLVIVYLGISLPFVAYGAIQTLNSNFNSPLNWVPESFPPRAKYDAFGELFGPGDSLIISWDGCTLADPRLDQLIATLRSSPDFYNAQGEWLLHHVTTGRDVVRQLISGPAPLELATAIERVRGVLVGQDGQTTCVMAVFTSAGLADRERIVACIQSHAAAVCGVANADQHLAGPVIDGLSVDRSSKEALSRLALPSALVVLAAACLCLRSISMGLIVFALALFAQAATLASVYYCGATMNALLIVLPPLIQVIAVAGGIHLINYYLDALPEFGTPEAPQEMLRRGWLPCVLSFGTTAAGAASLMVSELTPIRQFGAFAAVGVLITLGLLLSLLPAVLAWWPIKNSGIRQSHSSSLAGPSNGWWLSYTRLISSARGLVIGGAIAAIVAGAIGLQTLTSSVRIETLFGTNSKLVRDYAWLEQRLGPLVPIEIDLTFASSCQLSPEDRVTQLWQLNAEVRQIEGVRTTFSALTLLPSFPARESLPHHAYPGVLRNMLLAAKPGFAAARYVANDAAGEHWRLTAYVGALGDLDYGAFLDQLQRRLERAVPRTDSSSATVATACTGIMPLVHDIQRQMLADLFRSFLSAFAVVVLIMTVTQAGVLAGLVTMIPNVFPTLVLFGIFGWHHMSLDIGGVMTASIALGIAVDDTLHFSTFYRRGVARGMLRHQAVWSACEHCGIAMCQTSVVCGLGLAVFAGSEFLPTQRFAWMMVVLIALALAGDLIILPALLLSAAGKLFVEPSWTTMPHEADVEPKTTISADSHAPRVERFPRPLPAFSGQS